MCRNNRLTTLNLPNATEVYCSNNKLKELKLPIANKVWCSVNQIEIIYLPKAVEVYCQYNRIRKLVLPEATNVDCDHNDLIELYLPKVNDLDCSSNDRLEKLNAPLAKTIYWKDNPNLFRENVIAPNWEDLNSLPLKSQTEIPSNNPEVLPSFSVNSRNNQR